MRVAAATLLRPSNIILQIYDMLSQTGNWWLGKLIRDVPGGAMSRGTEGWVPSTFMDPFQGQLSYEEEVFTKWGDGKMTGNSSEHNVYPYTCQTC